jgi:hypothetical protein
MENIVMAKKVISVIIEEEIEEIELLPPDNTSIDVAKILRGIRLDFKAKICTKTGEKITVIIEMQKIDDPDPIIRFRRYLGRTYLKYETIEYETKNKKKGIKYVAHPIIAIYILGYNLDDILTPSVKINKQITDTTNQEVLDVKNEFIEMLTHRSYILQIRRLRPDRLTRVEKLLSLFDQKKISDNPYILDISTSDVDTEFSDMADYLHLPVTSEDFIRQMEFYDDVDRSLSEKEENLLQAKIEIRQKELVIQNKENEIKEKETVIQEKETMIQEKNDQIQMQNEMLKKLVITLYKSGLSVDKIMDETNISEEIIRLWIEIG